MSLKIIQHMQELLKNSEKFCDKDGNIFVLNVLQAIEDIDTDLVKLLLRDTKAKEQFFTKVEDIYVLNQNKLIEFFTMNEFSKNSYTSYTNKIGLIRKDNFIKKFDDVVLAWPHKDCILEGGQSKDDDKKNEVFYNEILSREEIDRLFEPKALTNIKKFSLKAPTKVTVTSGSEALASPLAVEQSTPTEITENDNLIIKGNNLIALHSLKKKYAGKVKLIYIDPPYNTGNDSFKYNDRFNHSTWLTFMKNRLEVAKTLLSSNGVIFIQCDDNEQAYLKVLMDEVFFSENYLSTIVVQAKTSSGASGGGEDKKLKKHAEYLTFYCKDITNYSPKKIYSEVQLNHLIEDKQRLGKKYEYDMILLNEGAKIHYTKILAGSGEEIIVYKHTNYEIRTIKQIAKEEKCDEKDVYVKYFEKIYRTQDAQSSIRHKVVSATNKDGAFYSIEYYPKSGKNKGSLTTNFYHKNELVNHLKNSAYKNSKGQVVKLREVGSIWADIGWDGIANEGGVKLKAGKKPEKLIERILNLVTNEGEIILDYHLGSGTTCAVAHKMNRRYIGIEQMDYIEDIAVERMKKVIEGEQGGISKALNWQGGGSFIYAELKQIDTFKDAEIGKLNSNMYYLPFAEIEDKEYGTSKEEITLNKKFYAKTSTSSLENE